jgi:hypothetical protein
VAGSQEELSSWRARRRAKPYRTEYHDQDRGCPNQANLRPPWQGDIDGEGFLRRNGSPSIHGDTCAHHDEQAYEGQNWIESYAPRRIVESQANERNDGDAQAEAQGHSLDGIEIPLVGIQGGYQDIAREQEDEG